MGLFSDMLAGAVGGAANAAGAIASRGLAEEARMRELAASEELATRRAAAVEAVKSKLESDQRQRRTQAIEQRAGENADNELATRYAEPVAGDTPLTPEQQAVQAEGLRQQRIERERERLQLMRSPEARLQASAELGYGGEGDLLAHRDRQAVSAARQETEAARQEARLLELQLRYGRGGAGAVGPGGEKAPAGYRFTEAGDLQAIPGGPADVKLQGAYNQDTAALSGGMDGFSRLASAANQLLNHPGLNGILGLQSKLPNFPGGDAADAAALLETLKSQVGFGVLQDMRNNSKTGGALGAVSDAEGKRLEANLAALDTKQSPEQFRRSLQQILSYTEGAKDRLQSAYNLKHGAKDGERPAGGSAGAPRINSPAELANLPSGALFTAPDGSIRRKP